MDNVSNNKTCMKELETLLCTRDVEFDALDCLVMCFPHIIHICVTHVLKSFTDAELTAVADAWIGAFPDEEEREAYAEAVGSDPMEKCHDLIWNIHASGFRRDEFMDTIRTGNVKNWFKSDDGEPVQVPELELLRDSKMCWDSCCLPMANRFRALWPVCLFNELHLFANT